MIAQIPPSTFEIPQYALWMLAGWILTTLIAGWSGYLWGLRSQKAAKKLEARIAVLSIVDKFIADVPKQVLLTGIFAETRRELKDPVFRFSVQLSKCSRLKVNKAWSDYQDLKIKTVGKFFGRGSEPDPNVVEQERKAILDALNHLRDVIADV